MDFNKSKQMSEKPEFVDRTIRKQAFFAEDRPKRFSRKRSNSRERSNDSKRSNDGSLLAQYIKNAANLSPLKALTPQKQQSSFQLATLGTASSLISSPERISRKSSYLRTQGPRDRPSEERSLQLKIESLQAEIELKGHELGVMRMECERVKLQIDEEKEKRRRCEQQRRGTVKTMQELQRRVEKLAVENKMLGKEKEYLLKQVQFLERINYDEKTRCIQSYREKFMEEELRRLREAVRAKSNQNELTLEKELEAARERCGQAIDRWRALQLLVDTLQGRLYSLGEQLELQRKITRERIIHSMEYQDLKGKYRRFLDQYKQIRAHNFRLKCTLEEKEAELLLSDSEDDPN